MLSQSRCSVNSWKEIGSAHLNARVQEDAVTEAKAEASHKWEESEAGRARRAFRLGFGNTRACRRPPGSCWRFSGRLSMSV